MVAKRPRYFPVHDFWNLELLQTGENHRRATTFSLRRPGALFLTINNNPKDPPRNFGPREYGYSKKLVGELVEGAPMVSPQAIPEQGAAYWADFLTRPPVAFITAMR
jgi:hypothetical protein